MEKLCVLGAGPQARVLEDLVRACGNLELIGFIDVSDERHHLRKVGERYPVYELDRLDEHVGPEPGGVSVVIGTAIPQWRRRLIELVGQRQLRLKSLVYPGTIIGEDTALGDGIIVMPGIIIGPGATLGNHVIINNAATVDHDTVLGENVTLGPGVHLAGEVVVRRDTFIGIGAACPPGVTIGANCNIGAGSVVIKDIPDNTIAAGVPARVIRRRD